MFFVVHFNLCFDCCLWYFNWRSSAGCMYSENRAEYAIFCSNLVVYLNCSLENMDISLCVWYMLYCTVGSNGKCENWLNPDHPTPHPCILNHRAVLTHGQVLPEAELKHGLWLKSGFVNSSLPKSPQADPLQWHVRHSGRVGTSHTLPHLTISLVLSIFSCFYMSLGKS